MKTIEINGVHWLAENLIIDGKEHFTYQKAMNACVGKAFRLPTIEEIKCLLDTEKVSSEWITQNGVNGRKFTDKETGNTLFFPAVGYRSYNDGTLSSEGTYGLYWSSTQDDSRDAYNLIFNSGSADWGYSNRYNGLSVRAVAA